MWHRTPFDSPDGGSVAGTPGATGRLRGIGLRGSLNKLDNTMAVDFANKEKSYELFEKAKRQGTWNPLDIDISEDKVHWNEGFSDEQREEIMGTFVGFYEGEESVTRTLVPYFTIVDRLEDAPFDTIQMEMFLTTHLYEEAKHTDFFARYFEEVIGTQETEIDEYEDSEYWQNPDLKEFLVDDLEEIGVKMREAARHGDQHELRYVLGEGVMHYMGIVETQLAKAGYEIFENVFSEVGDELGTEILPGFQEGVGYIRQDEGRHITNGRWLMKKLAEEDPDIVTEVYEPKIEEYLERLTGQDAQQEEDPYSAYSFDMEELQRTVSNDNLQQTIAYIGAEKFDRFDPDFDIVAHNRQQAAGD
jgi:ribonucleoside-diphosphate reductase beta chain